MIILVLEKTKRQAFHMLLPFKETAAPIPSYTNIQKPSLELRVWWDWQAINQNYIIHSTYMGDEVKDSKFCIIYKILSL